MDNKQPQMVPVQYVPYNIEEDEIDLKELIKTLLKHKKFIVIFTLIITLLAGIYAFTKTPVWEITANIELGYIGNSNSNSKLYLLNPYATKIYIENNYNNQNKLPKVNINFIKGNKDILQAKIDYYSNQQAIGYLNDILKDLKKQEQKRIGSYIENIKNQINIFTEYNTKIENQLTMLKKHLSSQKEPLIYQSTLNAIQNLEQLLIKNNLTINNLKTKISPANIFDTQVIGKIKTYNHPIKPKKKLIIIVAFITGFILSVFLVFFIEFIKTFKEDDV